MSERAREFLEHWKAEHVGAVADNQRLRVAVRLVLRCREDATCGGFRHVNLERQRRRI